LGILARLLTARLDTTATELGATFTLMAAFLPTLILGYIPWHCDQECIGNGALVSVELVNVGHRVLNLVDPLFAKAGSLGILTGMLMGTLWAHQPVIWVRWTFCCYNWCVLFWNDQFLKSVDTGPHDIGDPTTGLIGAAEAAARDRATVAAMLRLPHPPAPC
jgi:hypothetical protein